VQRCFRHDQRVQLKGYVQVGIVRGDVGGRGVAQREGLEDGPVLYGVAVARPVADAVESLAEDDQRSLLGELARAAGLERGGINLCEAERDCGGSKLAAQQCDPAGRVDVGVFALGLCGADEPAGEPAGGNCPEWGEVILAFDLGKLGQQGEVGAEASKRFEKAAKPLAGGVDDAIVGLRVVEAIAEGSVGVGVRPVGRQPGVWPAANAVYRLFGNAYFARQTIEWHGADAYRIRGEGVG
jgi:hypothetical protein